MKSYELDPSCRVAAGELIALAFAICIGAGCSGSCPPGTAEVDNVCRRAQADTAVDAGASMAVDGSSGNVSAGWGGASGAGAAAAVSGGPAQGGSSGSAGTSNAGGGSAGAAGSAGVMVAEACKGNGGKTVCDAQGGLFVCNADQSIAMQQTCMLIQLCAAGIASKSCAKCVPKQDFNCAGATLQVCADDGQSFVKKQDCDTEALCNKVAGSCTSAMCAAGKTTCVGNTLTKCNADGTAIEKQTPCDPGTCDAAGGDCNMCEPGAKKCQANMVATCNATGQAYDMTACPSGDQCVGLGMCIACSTDGDCSTLTQGCKVGVCGAGNVCMAKDANSGSACTASGKAGTCSSGMCQCTPQCTGKTCGDDGCGGTCGTCSGSQKCSANQCVTCTPTGGECASLNSADGCKVGMCSGGGCTTSNVAGPCHNGSGSGQCSAGQCVVCTPFCDQKCGGASDGCGGTCNGSCDLNTQMCAGQQCVALPSGNSLYSVCTGNSCAAGLVCFALGDAGSRCYHDSSAGCSNGEMEFPLGGVCLHTCSADAPACPTGTNCNVGGGGWCMAGTF